jgi:phage recombination protein Bet
MSGALVKHGFTQAQVELIKSTIMSGKTAPTDNDLALFGLVCQRTGLDPFSKQIYAIERAGKWTFQLGIDGLRAIAERSGQYAGSDEPLFDEGLTQYECEAQGRKAPTVCKVTVWRIIQGHRCPFVGVTKFSEYVQSYNGKPSGLWEKMPFAMLAKTAESQALRKAFPQVSSVEQSIQPQQEPDDWRIAGYEWGLSQGIAADVASNIANIAKDKTDLFARMKTAIPVASNGKVIDAEVF